MKKNDRIKAIEFLKKCRDPFFFIKAMWGLELQSPYDPFKTVIYDVEPEKWRAEWFGEKVGDRWQWNDFEKGKHITWQQGAILEGVRRAAPQFTKYLNTGNLGIEPKVFRKCFYLSEKNKIAVKSGNGIGKSCVSSWLVLWFLFCFRQCQIPCTAPTSSQMNDVLWKEVAMWLNKMPDVYKNLFEVTSGYIRVKEDREVWFARARTSRKETPEAFSGVHAEYIMALADEASGVPDIIYEYGKGIATAPFWLFFMFSNPTRGQGHFRDAFKEGSDWRQYTFDSRESPVVNHKFVQEKIESSGYDSDDFRIFVKGEFPKADAMDSQGYVPLLTEAMIRGAMTGNRDNMPVSVLGVDPSGEGNDKTAFVGRDSYSAVILAEEQVSTPKSIAARAATFISMYKLGSRKTVVDNFGEGANVAQELALSGFNVVAMNVGQPPISPKFLNKRAELAWKLREWIQKGGVLSDDDRWLELLNLRYRYNESGKLQLMPKDKMKKEGLKSPNFADALMLTFAIAETPERKFERKPIRKFEVYD